MWSVSPLQGLLQACSPAFTRPSFDTFTEVCLGWFMCLGKRSEFQVFEAVLGERVSRKKRHPFDRFYNFFNRSSWTVDRLACLVCRQVVGRFFRRGKIDLVVDGTVLHKRGRKVFWSGWFYDGNASTKKRLATVRGNKWVVIGAIVKLGDRSICLPIHAGLQPPGKNVSSESEVANRLLREVLAWLPGRQFSLVGDGGFSSEKLLMNLDSRVEYTGLLRSNAAIHEQYKPPKKRGPGRPAMKGSRLPVLKQLIAKADRSRSAKARWRWQEVGARGIRYQVCAFQATWPRVTGNRLLQILVCRPIDPSGRYKTLYLFTTDLQASWQAIIERYASRASIEAAFRSSKQVMQIQQPRHWTQQSVEKLAPVVWLMQTIGYLWYATDGSRTPQARQARRRLGAWETEWSLEFILRLLRSVILTSTFKSKTHTKSEQAKIIECLENYLAMAS